MAARPPAPVSWCTTGTRVTPSLAQQAVGWVTRQRPAAQFFNDLFGRLGDFTSYLFDGQFEGASSFDDDLAVAGDLTVTGDVSATNLSGNVVRTSWTETFFPILIDSTPFDASAQHTDGGGSTAGGYASNAGSVGGAYGYTLIPVAAGNRITGVKYWACGNGSADATAAVWTAPTYDAINTFSGSNVQLGLTVDTNRADTWALVTLGSFVAHTIASGSYVALFWTPNAAGYRVGPVEVTFDRPAV